MANPYTVFIEKPSDWPSNPLPPDPPPKAPAETGFNSGDTGPKRDLNRIVEEINDVWKKEDLARSKMKTGGDEAWSRYHGEYDFRSKDHWQSKKVSSDFHMTVERLTSVIIRIFEGSTDWCQAEAIDNKVQYLYNLAKNIVVHYLERPELNFKKFLRNSVKTMLLSQVTHALVMFERNGWHYTGDRPLDKAGVMNAFNFKADAFSAFGENPDLSMSQGFMAAGDAAKKKPALPGKNFPRLKLELLNPDYVVCDSSGRGLYTIWEVYYSKGEFLDEAKERGFDDEAVKRSLHSTASEALSTQAVDEAVKKDLTLDPFFHQKIKLRIFFGTLYDRDTGENLLRNEMVIVANETEVVYGPIENPFWDGQNPLISASPTEIPFSPYGKSPIVADIDMFDVDIEFMNLMLDFFQKVLLGMNEVDLDLLEEDDEDFGAGFYPGKLIKTRKGGRATPAVTYIGGGDVPAGLWQFLQYFQMKHQGNTALADSLGGMPRTRGRITAFEFNKRASEAGNYINHVFTALEDNFIAPILLLSFYRILQFIPDEIWKEWVTAQKEKIAPKEPNLKQQWESTWEQISDWTAIERWENLAGYFRFKVRFYSALGDRQMEIEKGTLLMQTVSNIPAAMQYVKWPELLRTLTRALGWNEEEIISAEALPIPAIPTGVGTQSTEAEEGFDLMGMMGMPGMAGPAQAAAAAGQAGPMTGQLFPGASPGMPTPPPGTPRSSSPPRPGG